MGEVRNQNKVGERNTCTPQFRVSYTREQGEVSLKAKQFSWDPSTGGMHSGSHGSDPQSYTKAVWWYTPVILALGR